MTTPKLSIIIPAYNSENTITRSIESCSEFSDHEVIVIDDGSTDDTVKVAREAGARVISQSNSGAALARRKGLAESKSEFIIFLDADDELVYDGVIESLNLLEGDPESAVAGGRVLGIWPDGRSRILKRNYDTVTAAELIRIGFGPWPPAASVIRRVSLLSANRLAHASLNTQFAEDYELIIRLSLVGHVLSHNVLSTKYQLYSGKSSMHPANAIRDKEGIRSHYSKLLQLPCRILSEPEIVASARMRASRTAFANGNYFKSIYMFFASVIASPKLFLSKLRKLPRKFLLTNYSTNGI